MENLATPEEVERWESIKKDFRKNNMVGGNGESDPVTRLVAQLTTINESINEASNSYVKPQTLNEETINQLKSIISGLRAVPVEVDINLIADEEDGVENIERTNRKRTNRKPKLGVKPEVRQGD